MKTIRVSIFCLFVLLTAPMLLAQDFSQYRNFSLGTNVAIVLSHTDQKLADVKGTRCHPALIQELTWWTGSAHSRGTLRPDAVEQMLFSFYNGDLYKISVIYDPKSTEGLTAEDMVKSISAKYGAPTYVALAIDPNTNQSQRPVASWIDSQYSFNLVRSLFTGGLELVIYSKRVNADAELALVEAVKLEQQEEPQREAERQRKETAKLEVTRQKNQKSFRP